MNFYYRHVGDYVKKTLHLSMLEDGAYTRLLDIYYINERALPSDFKKCCRLARCTTKAEKDAVSFILEEFFELQDDGYHNNRADAEIEQFLEAEPKREAKKNNDKERQERARARRSELFDKLKRHGVVMPYNSTTSALEAELSRIESRESHADVTAHVTRDNTATHTPDPRPQTPDPNIPGGEKPASSQHSATSPPPLENPIDDFETPEQTQARILAAGATPLRPVNSPGFEKFRMTPDWQPNPETLSAKCFAAGLDPGIVTPANLVEFTSYWSGELLSQTSDQWHGKLLERVRRGEARAVPRPPQQATDEAREAQRRRNREYLDELARLEEQEGTS